MKWTDHEIATLRRLFPHQRTAEVAARLGRTYSATHQKAGKLGLRKSQEFLDSPASGRLSGEEGKAYRFPKGQPAWNKGMSYKPGGRCAETQFRPGQRPSTARSVGATRPAHDCADGVLQIKIAEPDQWEYLHRYIWEQAYGPIPADHVVIFRDGNPYNRELENLELISRAENMRRNSYHLHYPKEIAELIQLRGALNRQINKREQRHEEPH